MGYEYLRIGNFIWYVLEEFIKEIEGGYVGFVFGSGMVVIIVVFMLFNSGDYVLIIDDVYGGMYWVIIKVLSCIGIEVIFIDISDIENIKKEICFNIKVIYIEIFMNFFLKIIDL